MNSKKEHGTIDNIMKLWNKISAKAKAIGGIGMLMIVYYIVYMIILINC